jgi:transcriptional regulator with XRE-family HTH domain
MGGGFMHETPGKRLKAARTLMGLTRGKFATLSGLEYLRLTNVERDNARMYVDDVVTISNTFPELVDWIMFSKPLDSEQIKMSENNYIKILFANYQLSGLPGDDDGSNE